MLQLAAVADALWQMRQSFAPVKVDVVQLGAIADVLWQ